MMVLSTCITCKSKFRVVCETSDFFLCHFADVVDEVSNIEDFTVTIAELHARNSSPDGRYGFSVATYLEQMPQYHTWTEPWEDFFKLAMERLVTTIEKSQGPDEELRYLFEQTMSKVVPQILRPLETGGRHIRPSLVHGDLYSGNVSVDAKSGRPVLYDAACLYAHNECESNTPILSYAAKD